MPAAQLAVALLVLLALPERAAAVEDPLRAMLGSWAGPIVARADGAVPDASEVSLAIAEEDGGIRFVLNAEGRELLNARLRPGRQPNLYEAAEQKGGLFDLFAPRVRANPLLDKELVWGRRESDRFVAYAFALDAGAYRLDRAEVVLAGEELTLRFERRGHRAQPAKLVAQLRERGR